MDAAFGFRDIAGLTFLGIAITAIWLYFRHMQAITERPPRK